MHYVFELVVNSKNIQKAQSYLLGFQPKNVT